MNTRKFFKCSNCGNTDFEPTEIGSINAMEGCFYVNSYVCTNCGHIELFDPEYDRFAEFLSTQEQIRKEEEREKKAKLELEKKQEILKLEEITQNENSTIKQVREAQEKLNELRQINSFDS